jgi:hypothetical protein
MYGVHGKAIKARQGEGPRRVRSRGYSKARHLKGKVNKRQLEGKAKMTKGETGKVRDL